MRWLRSTRDQCAAANVPCLVKQLPVWQTTRLHGGVKPVTPHWAVSSDLADFPPDLRIAQRPQGQKEGAK